MCLCVLGVCALRAEATSELHLEFENYYVMFCRHTNRLRGLAYANFPHDALTGAQLLR